MDSENGLAAGVRVGHFRIVRQLGAGGFGITYLADDLKLDREVALKEYFLEDYARRRPDNSVVPKNDASAETFYEYLGKFADEARTLGKFRHPNIVPVNELLEDENGTAYFAMPYLNGVDLETHVKQDGLPRPEVLLSIFRQLLDGCEAVHNRGILHRDIKPANIMMCAPENTGGARGKSIAADSDLIPVLIDFGAARKLATQKYRGLSAIVTKHYSPPEQHSSETLQGNASDIYSLAATVYFMLTGAPPPPAGVPAAPVSPARVAGFPPRFVPAVMRGLAAQMDKRPQTVAEWRALLGPLEDATAARERSRQSGWSRRTMVIGGGSAVAIAAAGGVGVAAFWPRSEPLSNSQHPCKFGWVKDFGALDGDPFGQVAVTQHGAMIAAHRLGDDGNPHMLGLFVDDYGGTIGEWVDAEPLGRAHAVLPMPDGGGLIGGTVGNDAVLARLGPDWKLLWRKVLPGAGAVSAILSVPNGVVIGLEGANSSGANLTALDSSANMVWQEPFDLGPQESIEHVVKRATGGFAILGSGLKSRQTASGNDNEGYAWVAFADEQGKRRSRIETTGAGAAFPTAIVEVGGMLYVAGATRKSTANADGHLFLWAIDSSCTEKWIRYDYPGPPGSGRALAVVDESTLYVAGWSGNNYPHAMRVAQVGRGGNLVWDNTPQSSINDLSAFGLAMRGPADGFATALNRATPTSNRLVIARLTPEG